MSRHKKKRIFKFADAGKLKDNRVEAFEKLLVLMEENKRVNQWK